MKPRCRVPLLALAAVGVLAAPRSAPAEGRASADVADVDARSGPRPVPAEVAGLSADDATLAALALALATAPPPEDLAAVRNAEGPRIELVATVRAARLVFEQAPRLRVAYGGSAGQLAWRAERTNLPARVKPGEVYEDVVVRVTLVGPIGEVASLLEDARQAARGIRLDALAAAGVEP